MLYSSLKDVFIFSSFCWESTANRIRYIVLSLVKKHRLFYLEPPVLGVTSFAKLGEFYSPDGPIVLTPYLPLDTSEIEASKITQELLENFIDQENISLFDSWYFSDAAWELSKMLRPQAIVYHIEQERELASPLAQEAHYIFSSQNLPDEEAIYIADGVDYDHFSQGRLKLIEPEDIAEIPSPRIGCYSIHDQQLIEEVASKRPDLHFIFLTPPGPIEMPNVHYLGFKNFYSLPMYLAHMNMALTSDRENHMMELLASGTPAIYCGEKEVDESIIFKAADVEEIIKRLELHLGQTEMDPYWIDRVDVYLQDKSWEHQVDLMLSIQETHLDSKSATLTLTQVRYSQSS